MSGRRPVGIVKPLPFLSEENQIKLCTLSKTFASCKKCRDPSRQEELLHETLPLFNEIFHDSPCREMVELFPDIHAFCAHVSAFFVKEIKIRAIDQTSEEGSKLIAAYLEGGLSHFSTNVSAFGGQECTVDYETLPTGTLLLLSLDQLACGASLIECMAAASVPSTLAKCLYIFLDLPPSESSELSKTRLLFQHKFTGLLQKICVSAIAAEELVQADALRHLFSASVDPCSTENACWRRDSCKILTTLAQNCLTPLVIQYIHDSGCIAECVENLRQMRLPKRDVIETFTSIFHVLSESSRSSTQLFDDFHGCGGYSAFTELLLKVELEDSEEAKRFCQQLCRVLGDLVFLGPQEIRPRGNSVVEMFQLPGFAGHLPKAKSESVRNIRAVDCLQTTFLRARSTLLCTALLERVKEIFERSPGNYFVLDKHHLISSITETIPSKPDCVQELFFSVFAFMVERMCYVPLQELNSVALLLRNCKLPSCLQHAFACLLRLVRTFPGLKEFYRNVGILEVVIQHLEKCINTVFKPCREVSLQDAKSSPKQGSSPYDGFASSAADSPEDTLLFDLTLLVLRLLRASVSGSGPEIELFTQLRGPNLLLTGLLPAQPPLHLAKEALDLLSEVLSMAATEDLLLGVLDVLPASCIPLRIEVMRLLCHVLRESHRCRLLFRKCNGFVHIVQEAVRLNGHFAPKADDSAAAAAVATVTDSSQISPHLLTSESKRQLILLVKAVIAVLTLAMTFEPASAKHFAVEMQFENLEQALRLLGCFSQKTVVDPVRPSSQPPAQNNQPEVAVESSTGQLPASPDTCATTAAAGFQLSNAFRIAFLHPELLECGHLVAMPVSSPGTPTASPTTAQRQQTAESLLAQLSGVPTVFLDICLIFRYLMAMATDSFDKYSLDPDQPPRTSGPFTVYELPGASPKSIASSLTTQRRFFASTPLIVHSGAVLVILRLLPAIAEPSKTSGATSVALQRFGLELVRAVMATERSQQILCDTDMPRILLTNFRPALASVEHPLHDYVSLLFGLLTAHSLTPRDFRDFLRLSGSFCEHAEAQTGSAQSVIKGVPGSRHSLIFESHDGLPLLTESQLGKSGATLELPALDSITDLIEETVWRQRSASQLFSQWVLPRDSIGGVGDTSALVPSGVAVCLPAFVEFDMSPEGFACLFLPSIAPQRIHAAPQLSGSPPGAVSSEVMCAGGVGSGERIFPPQGGLTFCSWVCVDDFGLGQGSSNLTRLPPHPVRLLTVVRGVQGTNEQSVCLAVWLEPLTRSICVTSKARLLSPDFVCHCQAPEDAHWIVFRTQSPRIAGGQAWPVGSWRHVALVFTRGYMVKQSSCSLYLDGQHVETQRFETVDSGPISTSVCAFLGTPPVLYQHSCLRWRQGPFQLIEEPLTASQIALIACLGPEYIGSLQAPPVPPAGDDCLHPLFAEEKLSFAIYGSSSTTLTISRIRKVYNATDATLIANVLRTQTRDNLTPIRVLLNVAFLLSGPSRCLGAVLVGYKGVRVFTPRPLASLLDSVANPSALLLSLVALSRSRAQLTNTLRAVFCVIDSSVATSIDMRRNHGYQLLVHILRRKNRLLDEGIVDLVLKLAFGSMIPLASQNNPSFISEMENPTPHPWKVDVFTDLLCDLRLWVRKVPNNDTSVSTWRDFTLVTYLLNQLVATFKNLFGLPYRAYSQSPCKSPSTNGTRPRKFVEVGLVEYLFSNTVYLILDVIHEAEQLIHSDPTSTLAGGSSVVLQQLEGGHFADPIASAVRMLGILLLSTPTVSILHHFSQLLIWTLPKKNESEKATEISNENDPLVAEERCLLIYVRNQCLLLLTHLLSLPQSLSERLCDEFATVLGPDWFLLFMAPEVHPTSVVRALRCFSLLFLTAGKSAQSVVSSPPETRPSPTTKRIGFNSPPSAASIETAVAGGGSKKSHGLGLATFREDVFVEGWTLASRTAHRSATTDGMPLALRPQDQSGDALQTDGSGESRSKINGFLALSALLVNNAHIPDVYMILIHLLLGVRTPCDTPPSFDFDDLFIHLTTAISATLTSSRSPCLSDEVIPPASFFTTRTVLLPDPRVPAATVPADLSGVKTAQPQPDSSVNVLTNIVCPEAATIIISLLSSLLRLSSDEKKQTAISPLMPRQRQITPDLSLVRNMPVVMLQFFSFLYQSSVPFKGVALSSEFITGLIDLIVIAQLQRNQPRALPSIENNSNASINNAEKETGELDFAWDRMEDLILGFLRTIVADSFGLPPFAHRPVHVADTVLETEHSSCSSRQQHELQTKLMRNLMEYLLAKDLLTDPGLLLHPSGQFINIPFNVAYFACRIVDKLWQGCFLGPVNEIVDFISQLIHLQQQSSAAHNSPHHNPTGLEISRSSLYRSLNRAILFQLSRPVLTLKDQRLVLSLLNLLLADDAPVKDLIFSSQNSDPEFPVCLAHLLIQHVERKNSDLQQVTARATLSPRPQETVPNCPLEQGDDVVSTAHLYCTTFDVLDDLEDVEAEEEEDGSNSSISVLSDEVKVFASQAEESSTGGADDDDVPDGLPSDSELPARAEEFEQLSTLALRLWEHSYMWNQKIFLALLPKSNLGSAVAIPSLLDWAQELEEPCLHTWTAYLGSEAAGCGGIAPAQVSGPPKWGVLSMYGQSIVERRLESTRSAGAMAASRAAAPQTTTGGGLSHQISRKFTRMSSNIFRMSSFSAASAAASPPVRGNVLPDLNEQRAVGRPSRHSCLLESSSPAQQSGYGSPETPEAPALQRVPLVLPLLTRRSTAVSTLKRIDLRLRSPITQISESLTSGKQDQERQAAFISRQVEIEWSKLESELTQDRSIWGPVCQDAFTKWLLDPTEGPCRMRKRMLPNPSFYQHYHSPGSAGDPESREAILGRDSTASCKRGFRLPSSLHTDPCFRRRHLRHLLEREPAELDAPDSRRVSLNTTAATTAPDASSTTPPDAPEGGGGSPSSHQNLDPGPTVIISDDEDSTTTTAASAAAPEDIVFGEFTSSEATLLHTSRLLRGTRSRSSTEVPTATLPDLNEDGFDEGDEGERRRSRREQEEEESNDLAVDEVEEGMDEEGEDEDEEYKPNDSVDASAEEEGGVRSASPEVTPHPSGSDLAETEAGATPQPPSPPTAAAAAAASSKTAKSVGSDQLTVEMVFTRLLAPGEKIQAIYRCARICGLDVHEGLLLFGRDNFYLIDGYTLLTTGRVADIGALPAGMVHEPVVPTTTSRRTSAVRTGHTSSSKYAPDLAIAGAVDQLSGYQYFRLPYDKIREVHRRRYLLQQTALEVFNCDGCNFLLVFAKDLRNKVFDCFNSVCSSMNSTRFGSLNSTRTSSGLLSSLLGEKTVMKRWERGEISNFQYLMYVNTQAGRSYNDLMQYPVFPWVLADYTSEVLDLTRPSTFRDLSKPMGAQTPARLAQFQRRFREWDDPSGETPPYHYGTHYSSAMIVASYLVRMEPFAQHFIKLQGGHFDLADRMFHSVEEAWLSASQHNMADVRELVPEFFYLPDFLVNSNKFDLGCKQNGTLVDDVVLPPWAKNDPREFIRAHREALESEYVSANLHHWIDLIFGYKQRGAPAVQAANVFHHLFYEGNVDIYAIDDPVKRRAVVGFINNFGQIPRQIFRKPHPAKKVPEVALPSSQAAYSDPKYLAGNSTSGLFFHNLGTLKPCMSTIKELRHAVGQILQLDPGTGRGSAGGPGQQNPGHTGLSLAGSILPGGIFSSSSSAAANGSSSTAGGGANSNSNYVGISPESTSLISGGPIVVVEQNKVLLPPTFTRSLAWGFPDDSFRICSLADGREKVLQVFETVSASRVLCAVAPNASTIITAGLNSAIKVWQLRGPTSEQGKPFSPVDRNSESAVGVFSTTPSCLRPLGSLYGHTDVVTCLAASEGFNMIVSGSRDCTCIMWDLRYLIFLRQLGTYRAPVAAICISEASGDIAVCAGSYLHLWNISGEPIASLNTTPDQSNQIFCVSMSTLCDWDPDHVIITGGSDGVVRMWGLDYVREGSESADASEPSTGNVAVSGTAKTHVPRNHTTIAPTPPTDTRRWRRQLSLRAELTMHTAFERADNPRPAALTAIGVSRDHRSVLVGDSRGRVFAWSVPPRNYSIVGGSGGGVGGGPSDHWVRDEAAVSCAAPACAVRFSITERRHHCRNCGKVFCSRCSRFESEIHRLRIFRPVRVCTDCFALLKDLQTPVPAQQSSLDA